MSYNEIVNEIAAVKQKLMNDSISLKERDNLLIALLALYETALNAKMAA